MAALLFDRPRALVLAIGLILVAGLSALAVLPRTEDPELVARNAMVVTRFPGATPERVEALVTEKLEEELEEIEEIGLLQSTSTAGVSIVQVELRDDVSAVDEVWSRVRDRVDDAQRLLPAGALDPDFEEFEIAGYTWIGGLVWASDAPVEAAILRRLGEELEDALRAVPGTKRTEVFGEGAEEIRVEFEPTRLAGLGLTAEMVARRLAESDAKNPAGAWRGAGRRMLFEVDGELDALQRVEEVPIARGPDGRLLRIGDLARVAKTVADPPAEVARVGGRPAVTVAALMESGRRVDDWSARALAAVERFEDRLPAGVELVTVFDQSRYTNERLGSLFQNLLVGALLVMGVVFVAMGWRSALLVGSALPLSALMVFAGMRALGIPLHQMSVTGLIIALGLLIDNAIVVVDEVRARFAGGGGVRDAIAAATRGLRVPLLGSTVTTTLAFFPLVLMPGPAGEFVGTMAVSVILAVASSLLLALTVVPALSGVLERRLGPPRGRRFWSRGIGSERLRAGYERALEALYARPLLAIGLALVAPVLGFLGATTLTEQFFPAADRDQLDVELELSAGSSIHETVARAEEMRARLLEHPAVEEVHWFIGGSGPKSYYNLIEGRSNEPHFAQAIVRLRTARDQAALVRELQRELDAAVPAARTLVRRLEQGPPVGAPIELRLHGPELELLSEEGEELRAILAGHPGVTHTRATLTDGEPKLSLALSEEELERAGVGRVELAARLDAAIHGAVGGSVLEGDDELPVRVRLAQDARADLARLASLELPVGGDGALAWMPLETVVDFVLEPMTGAVPRRDGERVNSVQAFVAAGTLSAEVLADLTPRLAELGAALPPGYRLELGGEAAERDEAVGGLMASASVLLVLMAATLVLSFDSFRYAALIGAVGFAAVGLALGALTLAGHPFGFMAIVGTMGLVGVAINDSIVVLSALRHDPRARAGELGAVRRVVVRATRHVLSTTVTTIAGFLPLLLAGGSFWPPVAVTIAGGVTGATGLALLLVPAAHVLLARPRAARAVLPRVAPSALGSVASLTGRA